MTDQIIVTTTENTTEPKQDSSKRYRCRHIFIDGHRCGSPSLRGEPFCYYHHSSRGFADEKRLRRTWSDFELPAIEDRSSVLAAINEVLQRIAGNNIAAKEAGLLLYGLQIASLNLPEPAKATPESEDPPVEDVVITHPYGDLAPVAEFVDAPQSTVLPNLNASTDTTQPARPSTSNDLTKDCHSERSEEPPHFARSSTPLAGNALPANSEINTANPAPSPSAWYPNNCHAYEKRTSRPPHSAHRHQAAQRRRSRRCHELHGLQLA